MAKKGVTIVRRVLLFLVFLSLGRTSVRADEALDSIDASLITCSPGTEVYSLYGHTALRIQDFTQGLDIVFNYGVFNFNAPHFMWRFTLGQCDYLVMPIPYELFLKEYQQRGSSVVEQTLNLTQTEANRLFALLMVNIRPENRTYRYNYLTSNCTTKVRDIIGMAVEGPITYKEAPTPRSYRQIMHKFTAGSPWAELGNDILLGADCDTLLTDYAAMFIPSELESYFDEAQLYDSLGNRRPLVKSKQTVVPAGTLKQTESFPLSPLAVGLVFVALCLVVALVEYRTRHMWWVLDAVLLFLQGVAGCMVCFMFCFSEHPTVDSNWQIWVLNPIPLVCLPWVVRKAVKRLPCVYHYVNAAVLTLFIVLSAWIPQDFSEIIVPLAFGLLIRSASYCLNYNRG